MGEKPRSLSQYGSLWKVRRLCGPFGLELRTIPLQKRTQNKLDCPTVSCEPVVLTLPNASFDPLIEFPMLW